MLKNERSTSTRVHWISLTIWNSEEIISNNVVIEQDSAMGSVGFFEKRAYVDAGLKSKSALQADFTITAWVKPTELGRANSILGKGESFIVKIHDGLLTFTMADIKDYTSTSSLVPSNQWTHIALVYSKLKTIEPSRLTTRPSISTFQSVAGWSLM